MNETNQLGAWVIGSIDFKEINPFCGQIDYALGFEHWNKGIMSEAATAVRDWAFENLPEMVRLQAFCIVENTGSSMSHGENRHDKRRTETKNFCSQR